MLFSQGVRMSNSSLGTDDSGSLFSGKAEDGGGKAEDGGDHVLGSAGAASFSCIVAAL